MSWFGNIVNKVHDITAWVDPVTHYSLDAINKSSNKSVSDVSGVLGNAGILPGLAHSAQTHANENYQDFGTSATRTALAAGAVYGGITAASNYGSGAVGSGTGYTEAGGGVVNGTADGGLTWSGGTAGAGSTGELGVGGVATSGTTAASGSPGYWQAAQAGLGAAGSLYSSYLQSQAAKDAAAATLAQNQQTRADTAPWRAAGAQAIDTLANETQPGGYFGHQFNAQDLNANLAPNYAFSLQQGQQANQNAAGVGGGLVGGNALQGLDKWTQDYAQGAYQQAYANYTGNQTNIFNRLSNIAGLGQTANQITTGAGTQNVANANNYLTSGAAANAAGVVGATNSANNGIGNYLGWNYLNAHG